MISTTIIKNQRLTIATLGLLLLLPALAQAEPKPDPDSRGRSTAVALNYCRASFHRIRRYPSTRVLLEERENILNNLDLNGIADEEVIRLYSGVLDEICQEQVADKDREFLKTKYKRAFRHRLGTNAFLFGTQVASAQFLGAVRTGAASWWDYRETGWNRDLDTWRVDKQRIGAVVDKSSRFLDTFWKMAKKKNIPDRWLIRSADLDKLEDALNEDDPAVRLRVLKRMKGFMECYPPYWYHVARTQQSMGQLFAAAATYHKLADLASGHFRRDEMLAAGLANRAAIQEYLRQPTAVETALEALKYSTTAWEANLLSARILERHRMFAKAEDAILRNLDVNLEREQSLVALVSLYYNSDNEKKLVARLSDEETVDDVPIRFLLQCAGKLGAKKVPAVVFQHIGESLYGFPSLHFGPDDFVVAALPAWQFPQARVSLRLDGKVYGQPRIELDKGNLQIRFRNVLDLGSPLQPPPGVPEATLTLNYVDTPPIVLTLQRTIPPVANTGGGTPATIAAKRPNLFSRWANASTITDIAIGDTRFALQPQGQPANGVQAPDESARTQPIATGRTPAPDPAGTRPTLPPIPRADSSQPTTKDDTPPAPPPPEENAAP